MNIGDYKILMVDDDEEYLFGRETYLRRKGCDIKTMSNPIEAIEYLKENEIDILFVDYFMPQMTGEEVINALRLLNKEIVIVLQTGYAGEKPPISMFEGITIQGYFDKNNSTDELLIVLLSAIRTAELLREIKQREEEKQIKKLKDEFFADKISTITGEINGKLMSIGGPTMVLEDWTKENIFEEEKKEFTNQRLLYIKDATGKIRETIKALNIASEKEIEPQNMIQKINELLKIEMSVKRVQLNMEISEDFAIINTEEGTIPYLICKDIENRINAGSKNIKITSQKDVENIIIRINSEIEIPSSEKEQLKKVASFCKFAQINVSDAETELIVEKIKE